MLVDSQIHLFAHNASERAERIGQKTPTAEEVIAEMDRAGVARAYLVPAGSAANPVCLEAARQWPNRFRVMGIPRINDAEFRATFDDWRGAGYVGARLSFPPFRDPSWLDDGTADWFWEVAEASTFPVTIWAPGRAASIAAIANAHPGLRIAIDHLNLFVDDRGRDAVREVVAQILPLAAYPNVAVKASALPAHSMDTYPYGDLHDSLADVLSAFGPDRVFWGTDITRLPCDMQGAVQMFREAMAVESAETVDRVMGNAALDWFGW